ncbi:uncharacterized protein PHALS_01405 [Plasmopara halstedii]|uniref:Uncharacterized protein n=1 Tax=Plasmopara halstedii TaxID=4781 RepID=A0A0P1AUI1_PLAHL|nr:uncharacterized protein PHALS_01405 [Plasmopara halstedii]CEG45079.1 hypothetical protein PHALS_01405 [Plasmopara halstedii]|eukprot:XP_024581448.1 hypothetical protein PHALS_01405 [Plasmopara halstedii]
MLSLAASATPLGVWQLLATATSTSTPHLGFGHVKSQSSDQRQVMSVAPGFRGTQHKKFNSSSSRQLARGAFARLVSLGCQYVSDSKNLIAKLQNSNV